MHDFRVIFTGEYKSRATHICSQLVHLVEEVIEYLLQIWELVREQVDSEFTDVQAASVDTLLDGSKFFALVPEFSSRVLGTLDWLRGRHKMRVLERTIEILHFDRDDLPPDLKEQWEQLRDFSDTVTSPNPLV